MERHITAKLNLTSLQVGRQMSSQQNCRMIPGSSVASSRPPPIIVTLNFNFQQLLSATIGGGRKIFCDWHLIPYQASPVETGRSISDTSLGAVSWYEGRSLKKLIFAILVWNYNSKCKPLHHNTLTMNEKKGWPAFT